MIFVHVFILPLGPESRTLARASLAQSGESGGSSTIGGLPANLRSRVQCASAVLTRERHRLQGIKAALAKDVAEHRARRLSVSPCRRCRRNCRGTLVPLGGRCWQEKRAVHARL